ncbi:MAG: AMP-binding protein [Marinilabiliales bacterium]|nr:AMP-binding protein [Marinilabiliales bacterium]
MELLEKTFGQFLEQWADLTPDKDFLVYPDRGLRFSYATFNQRVDNLAKALILLGVKRGDKVGIFANNVPDWLTYFFATAKIGGVLVTVNTNYRSHELAYLVKNSDLHTLCLVNGWRDIDYIQMVYELVPELKESQRGYLKSESFPELRNVIFMGPEKHRGMYNTPELILLGSQTQDDELKSRCAAVSCYDVVNMQYTSGTTGFPKGVMLTHHNILNNGHATASCMNYSADERLCVCVPLFHCFGCVLALCAIITSGATMVMVENFDPLTVLASVQKERCTALYGVPTMFIAELNHPMFPLFDLSSLRTGIMAGAPCPIETMNAVMSKMNMTELIIVYGLTESSPGMTATRVSDPPEIRSTTVGKAYPAVEVLVADPETGEEMPVGQQGELCCKGYNVMKGYYKNEEATAKAIDSRGWLHSGDLGVMDENGYFKVTGRIKDMIIRGGENVYPREIENFLYTHPDIEAVEIVGVASEKYGEEVGAFIKKKAGSSLSEEDVADYCRGKISRFKIPRYIFFVSEFPMTASGKIQKYKLREMALERVKAMR